MRSLLPTVGHSCTGQVTDYTDIRPTYKEFHFPVIFTRGKWTWSRGETSQSHFRKPSWTCGGTSRIGLRKVSDRSRCSRRCTHFPVKVSAFGLCANRGGEWSQLCYFLDHSCLETGCKNHDGGIRARHGPNCNTPVTFRNRRAAALRSPSLQLGYLRLT
jgi:hypothetical protein